MTTLPAAAPLASCVTAIHCGDGVALPATVYGDADTARAAIVINSALGVPRAFYRGFASFLARQGYCVLCYDYYGNGIQDVAALRRNDARLSDWGRRDFAAAALHMRARVPERPLVCIGHSVGGQLPGLLKGQTNLDALITICSQSGDWRLWTGAARRRAWLQFHLAIPLLTALLGYFPGQRYGLCTLPAGVAREWARWCRRRGYAAHPRSGHADGFARLRAPALFISTHDDTALAPRAAVDALAALYRNARGQRLHLEAADAGGRAIGHFGYFNPATGKRLWPQLAQWLDTQLATTTQETRTWSPAAARRA